MGSLCRHRTRRRKVSRRSGATRSIVRGTYLWVHSTRWYPWGANSRGRQGVQRRDHGEHGAPLPVHEVGQVCPWVCVSRCISVCRRLGSPRPHLYPDWAHPSPAPHHYPRTHDTRALALQHALAWLLPYQHLPAHASTHAGTHPSYYTGLRARVLGARARIPLTERGNGPPQTNKQTNKAQNGLPPSRTSAPAAASSAPLGVGTRYRCACGSAQPLLGAVGGNADNAACCNAAKHVATQHSVLQRSTACCSTARHVQHSTACCNSVHACAATTRRCRWG